MAKKGKSFFAVVLAVVLLGAFWAPWAFGHAIDYTAYDIQPQEKFDGGSGNFRFIDPIAPNTIISFRLTLELVESAGGGTSVLPATITFGVKNSVPADMVIGFGASDAASVSSLPKTIVHTFEKVAGKITSLQTSVTAMAPATPGSYFFKIQATGGYKGNGLQPGEGIVVHFKVAEPQQTDVDTVLNVVLESSNIIYHKPDNYLFATLTEKISGQPVTGQPLDFYDNDGNRVGSVVTGSDGTAAFAYNTGGLEVGDYTVAAKFEGTPGFRASSNSTNQCITYKWLGFLPPVLVQDPNTLGLGIGLFQGKVIPVKARIADFYDTAVPGKPLRIYFAQTNSTDISVAVAIQPTIAEDGNLMRYIPPDGMGGGDFYMLNWNISGLSNGSYNIRVGADEGECATGHWVPVRIGKASK
ncbi:MAG: hypothetical protein A4E65_02824 [Syntrophorhabdus sp. PtaU1.Bin153]|nr:MAG: hypothetical protein A4E65_02824 [Syntrophorhabdus sp. PtaU1.Bin153]